MSGADAGPAGPSVLLQSAQDPAGAGDRVEEDCVEEGGEVVGERPGVPGIPGHLLELGGQAVSDAVALLKALGASFAGAFSGTTTAPLLTFLVTVSDVDLLNLSSAFWGLATGLVATWFVRRTAEVEAATR